MFCKFWEYVRKAQRGLCGLLLGAIIFIICLQIVTRYVLVYSLPWSEELSRYLFVWMIFLSLSITIHDDMPIRIDFLDQYLGPNAKKAADVVRFTLSILALMVLLVSSLGLIQVGMSAKSPALKLPQYVVYLVIPIGCVLSILETGCKLAGLFRKEEGSE